MKQITMVRDDDPVDTVLQRFFGVLVNRDWLHTFIALGRNAPKHFGSLSKPTVLPNYL